MSRLLCLYLGSPHTYASLGRPVAPGQMSLAAVLSLTGRATGRGQQQRLRQ